MGQLQMNLDIVTADPRMDVTQARPNTDRHRLMAPRHRLRSAVINFNLNNSLNG